MPHVYKQQHLFNRKQPLLTAPCQSLDSGRQVQELDACLPGRL